MKYEALLACDIPQYAMVRFEAIDDDTALAHCMQLLSDGELCFEGERASAWDERIISLAQATKDDPLAPQSRRMVACDVCLDANPLHDNAFTLLSAAKAVREWASQLGGWEAPCWTALDEAIAACEGKQSERLLA